MMMRSGISALDERTGGFREGGLHLLAGSPGSGRLVALLHFLEAGLSEGDAPVGLVTSAPPTRIFEEAASWGFSLEEAWRAGRLRLLAPGEDFERRLTSAADPSEVYEEMQELLGPGVRRLALHPGPPLWDARSGTSFASRFMRWIEGSGTTVLASMSGPLDHSGSPATEWILQAAAGIFEIEAAPEGHRRLILHRVTPTPADDAPIEVDLVPGEGIVPLTPEMRFRRARVGGAGRSGLLVLELSSALPAEIRSWAAEGHEVEFVPEALEAMERLGEAPDRFRALLLHLDRRTVGAAVRACRLVRRLSKVPILVLSEDAVRSSDRLAALQAGANDFLTGPFTALELASRIDHAVIAGGRPAAEAGFTAGDAEGGTRVLAASDFRAEAEVRLDAGSQAPFTLVHVRAPTDPHTRSALLETIRADQGDRVGEMAGGIGVLLHGAPVNQVPSFLARVEQARGSDSIALDWEAFGSTVDPAAIRALLARAVDHARPSSLQRAV